MSKRTFAFLKPNNCVIQRLIIERLKSAGFVVIDHEVRTLEMETLRAHYAHHVDKPFFRPMAEYLISGPSVLLILERVSELDPVQALRDLVGPTDPKQGKPGQIRHDFGVHDTEIFFNAIHASDLGEAEEEIARFFPED